MDGENALADKLVTDAEEKYPSVSSNPGHEFADAPYSLVNVLKDVSSELKNHRR